MIRTVTTEYGEITYDLTKKKVKNLNMRVKPDGTVLVSAPNRVPLKDLDRFVIEKADFIHRARENFRQNPKRSPRTQVYQDGGTVYYLGQPLTLSVVSGKDVVPVRRGDCLEVVTASPEDEAVIRSLVAIFYREACEDLFRDLMRGYQARLTDLGIPQATLKIRDMKTRWGTCHTVKAVITLNSKLIYTPYSAVSYVVLHEFCHFIHPNHSKAFYDLVAQYMPDWKAQREELKKWSCRD